MVVIFTTMICVFLMIINIIIIYLRNYKTQTNISISGDRFSSNTQLLYKTINIL